MNTNRFSLIRSLRGESGFGEISNGGTSSEFVLLEIGNPSGSGVNLIITEFLILVDATMTLDIRGEYTTFNGTTGSLNADTKNMNSGAPSVVGAKGSNASKQAPGNRLTRIRAVVDVPYTWTLTEPMIVPPNDIIAFEAGSANTLISLTFQFLERPGDG